jgi:hypothetical protein
MGERVSVNVGIKFFSGTQKALGGFTMYKNAKTKKWAKKYPNGYRGKNHTKKPDADDGYEGKGWLQQEKEVKENFRDLKRLEVARRQKREEFVPTVIVRKKKKTDD